MSEYHLTFNETLEVARKALCEYLKVENWGEPKDNPFVYTRFNDNKPDWSLCEHCVREARLHFSLGGDSQLFEGDNLALCKRVHEIACLLLREHRKASE